ncbi:hypothetical protein EK904_013956 [Melospiza melodia maxima]|nr:hypothetical protein EK904_013956 [Melospiza melodia maxima]
MKSIRVNALLHVGAIVAVDIFFHFFYILTLPSDLKFVNRLSDWSLGEWLCLGTFTPVLSSKAVGRDPDLHPPPLRGFGNECLCWTGLSKKTLILTLATHRAGLGSPGGWVGG